MQKTFEAKHDCVNAHYYLGKAKRGVQRNASNCTRVLFTIAFALATAAHKQLRAGQFYRILSCGTKQMKLFWSFARLELIAPYAYLLVCSNMECFLLNCRRQQQKQGSRADYPNCPLLRQLFPRTLLAQVLKHLLHVCFSAVLS